MPRPAQVIISMGSLDAYEKARDYIKTLLDQGTFAENPDMVDELKIAVESLEILMKIGKENVTVPEVNKATLLMQNFNRFLNDYPKGSTKNNAQILAEKVNRDFIKNLSTCTERMSLDLSLKRLIDEDPVSPEYNARYHATKEKIVNLVVEEKYDELVELINENTRQYTLNPTEEAYADLKAIDSLMEDLTIPSPDSENNNLSNYQVKILRDLYAAANRAMVRTVIEAGKSYDQWVEKLQNKQVKGTELFVDNPKFVKKLAHDLTISQGEAGNNAGNAAQLTFKIKTFLSSYASNIEGEDAKDILNKDAVTVNNAYRKELGVSVEEFNKASDVIEDTNTHEMETGFKVRISPVVDEDNLFDEIPRDLPLFQSFASDEQVQAFVDEEKSKINDAWEYDSEVRDVVDEAKKFLERLKATEEGHGQSDSYKKMKFALENFTKLGSAYLDTSSPGDKQIRTEINAELVKNAFFDLRDACEDYEKDHSGLSNIHRSNFGYGKERLDISRELQKFADVKEKHLSKFKTSLAAVGLTIKFEKRVELLNKVLVSKGMNPVTEDFKKLRPRREGDIERANAFVKEKVDKKSLPIGYGSYIKLHTYEGDFEGKTRGDKVSAVAKVLAAFSLEKDVKKFSVDTIRKMAKVVTEVYCLDQIPERKLDEILKDRNSVLRFGDQQRSSIYDIKNGKYEEFVNEMKTLSENMIPEAGHHQEYKDLVKSIKDAAKLNTAGLPAEGKSVIFQKATQDIIFAVTKYINGKEKTRRSQEGKDCFNNAMDALSIVSKYTKKRNLNINERVKSIVEKVQKVRGEEETINVKDFEKTYGANRAKERMQEIARENAPAL